MAALLVKYPDMQHLAQRAFITYLRSIHIQRDKEVFDVTKLSIDEFSASFGLPMTPKVRFLKERTKSKTVSGESSLLKSGTSVEEKHLDISRGKPVSVENTEEEMENAFLLEKDNSNERNGNATGVADEV